MWQIKRILVALVLATPMLGCGKSSDKVEIKEATAEQIAEQEATQKTVASSEADHLKTKPKEKTQQESVEDAERAHSRQQRR